ncbi:MAG: 23S rRNA (pseudouridine(1915)-N(3))-methyltransferase RlmH [Lachnospiraceae bacterium]|nr:23S rRNA (pseudouridine(1915)-N(3))-methyltransferase RlmH [Lachnospiraceae bacterium]
MKIRVLCVGKIKEPYLRKGIDYYIKAISKKTQIEIVELEDEKTPDHASVKEENLIKATEGNRMLKYIPDQAKVVALCIEGKAMTTLELTDMMKKFQMQQICDVVFIIGGSLGLADFIVKRADVKLSFSNMTFPHQMMRMILLEQIERIV